MEIIQMDVDKLIPYEWNNKIHDETQVNRIANSIREFGFTNPILIDKNNVIINGHGRLEAAKKLGLKKVDCMVAEGLTDKQVKKLRILDNKLNESEWNLANLKQELDELGELNIGELDLTITDLFPEFDAPEFNPDDYEDFSLGGGETKLSLTVYVKDDTELELLKKDLDGLGYTNYK